MINVIETNIFIDDNNNIFDHQSRVIEVDDWDSFVNEIKEGKTIIRNSILGCMSGCTIPKQAKVENLVYDEKRLSCNIYNYLGVKTKKLVYRI